MGYDWQRHAWDGMASRRGRALRILVGRADGRVALIWPLVRDGNYLRFLSSDTVEYRDILVENGPPGEVRFARVTDEEEIRRTLAWLLDHKLRWLEARNWSTTKLRSSEYRAFVRNVCRAAHAAGQLVVGLRSGADTISAGFGFRTGRTFPFYMFAYDAAWASCSPSRLLMERLIQLCVEDGVDEFVLMPGDMAYKESWTNADVMVADYFVPITALGRALAVWHGSGRPACARSRERS